MVDFDEDKILIHHGNRPFDPEVEADVTYACIEQLSDGKYLVTKQQPDREHLYQCVQFVVRSDTVVQWRLSAESEVHSALLCDDHSLKLQEAPFVYYRVPNHWDASITRQRQYVPCPLEGGYFISQWGNSTHESTCRDNIPPSKLESECSKGDGIRYQTGNGGCTLPFADGRAEQLFCLATWENSEFMFSIVVAKDVANKVSCMRYPASHGHSFTAHIFTDGVCHMGYDVQTNPWQRSITMSPHIETSLCGDDTQACVMNRRLKCNETISRACRETCDACPHPAPWENIKISRAFHGRWVLFRELGLSHEVGINEKTIEIPTLGKFEVFSVNACPSTGSDVTSGKKRYVFLTNFENGCSPRLTAIELFKRSDAVISLRISESVQGKYTMSRSNEGQGYTLTGWKDWCHDLHFQLGPIAHDDSFRTDASGWYNLIHKDRTSVLHQCTFPESLQRMRLALTSGSVNCTAKVEQESQNGFNVKLEACQSQVSKAEDAQPSESIGSPISLQCLASFGGRSRGTQYFITRTISEARIADQMFMCWSLDLDGLSGYLLPVSDCDDNSAEQIRLGAQTSAFGRLSAMGRSPLVLVTTPSVPPQPGATLRGAGSGVNQANGRIPAEITIVLLGIIGLLAML